MEEKKEMMTLTLENGTKEEVELLLSFKFNDNNKEYVIYTKNEKRKCYHLCIKYNKSW